MNTPVNPETKTEIAAIEAPTSMDIEAEIARIEKEIGGAPYPHARAGCKNAEEHLKYLRMYQGVKNRDPELWRKMCNWD